jgi:hypothetical protein
MTPAELRKLADKASDGSDYSPDGYHIPVLDDLAVALRQAADELERLKERERVLREALEWYAKRRHYEYDFESGSPVWIDNGSRAREALAATKGES